MYPIKKGDKEKKEKLKEHQKRGHKRREENPTDIFVRQSFLQAPTKPRKQARKGDKGRLKNEILERGGSVGGG